MIRVYTEWFIICDICGNDGSCTSGVEVYSNESKDHLKKVARKAGWKLNPEICPKCQKKENKE